MNELQRWITRAPTSLVVLTVLSGVFTVSAVVIAVVMPEIIFGRIETLLSVITLLILLWIAITFTFRIRQTGADIHMLRQANYEVLARLDKALDASAREHREVPGFKQLQDEIETFVRRHPYERNVAFIGSYEDSVRANEIFESTRRAVAKLDLTLWRASERQIARDVISNVIILLASCRYAIAVFSWDEQKGEPNPNVAFELGISYSLGRDILLLKDTRIERLPTDLLGYVYHEYDDPAQIETIVAKWFETRDGRH